MTTNSQGAQATGISRLADVMFIGFAISPHHSPHQHLTPETVKIEVITTRQFDQSLHYQDVARRLTEMVRKELGVSHIYGFNQRLDEVSPPAGGYAIKNRRVGIANLRLGPGVTCPATESARQGKFLLCSYFHVLTLVTRT